MGILQKAGNFLGINKFGQGAAAATRVLTGEVKQDIAGQNQTSSDVQKLLYAARNEKDAAKKQKLLKLAQSFGTGTAAETIDPNLNLSNKEILGSAANVALNVATPGAFQGSKTAVVLKNAALGSGFGLASGLEKNRSTSGVIGSGVGGGLFGAGLGLSSIAVKAAKDFVTVTTSKWLMNKAVTPTLNELRKNVRFGSETLGNELLKEGVKGGPKKLLQIADGKLATYEDELRSVLTAPGLSEARISRSQIHPYVADLVKNKAGTPGLAGDAQRIKDILKSMPEELTLPQANEMKRRIYGELADPAYRFDAKLSTKAQALKQIAKGLKTEIENTVGGTVVKDINRKLSIYGRLQDTITDQMARSMKNHALGLTDALLLIAGGAGSALDQDSKSKPLGLLAALLAIGARHNSTAVFSEAANLLNKGQKIGTGVAGQAVKETARRTILNAP
jgi:hypothetical protein